MFLHPGKNKTACSNDEENYRVLSKSKKWQKSPLNLTEASLSEKKREKERCSREIKKKDESAMKAGGSL